MADDLAALEESRLRALVAGDRDRMYPLHAHDYELITPGGVPLSRADYLDALSSGQLRYSVFEPVSPIRVHQRGDTAILRYRVHIEIDIATDGDVDHDGGIFWHTDYWERRDGRWEALWSQATRILA